MSKKWLDEIKQKLSGLKKKKSKPDSDQTSLESFSDTGTDTTNPMLAPKKESPGFKQIVQDKIQVLKEKVQDLKNLDKEAIKAKLQTVVSKVKNIKIDKDTPGKVMEVGNKFKKRAETIEWNKIPDYVFSNQNRGYIHRIFTVTSAVALSYGAGKTGALLLKGKDPALKKEAVTRPPIQVKTVTMSEIKMVGTNNIFRTDTKSKDGGGKSKKRINRNQKCLAATKPTKLPITLINTVVLQDQVKSIASVQMRSKREALNVRVGDTIGKYAKVDKITRLELILKNLKTGNCELLSSKDLKKKKSPITVLSPTASKYYTATKDSKKGISNDGNNFKISRKVLKEKMKDISSILTQARAIKLQNPDGTMSFKITEIVPDSVFSNLGIQNDDIIVMINGKPISNMNQVMSLFGSIQTVDNLSIEVKRDGRKVPLDYSFTQ
jgi:type II secretion system protein C